MIDFLRSLKITRVSARILIASFLVLQIVLSYVGQANLVQAQIIPDPINTNSSGVSGQIPTYTGRGVEETIKQYLCVPDEANLGSDLYVCITKVYRFGVAFGAIALVFFVVFAGYMYISGGEAAKEKGKGMILSALTGMAIILSSYVLLSFINPDLVKIKPIQPPVFTATGLPECKDVGLGVNCVLPTGQVQVGNNGGGVAGSASEAQYRDLMVRYATKNQMKYCHLSALIDKESSFIYNNVSNGPPNRVDPNHADKKFYGLPFTRAAAGQSQNQRGHGIGLGQVFIWGPPDQWRAKGWSDASTPSRDGKEFGFNKSLTITDLIDPETSISAAAFFFKKKLDANGGDVQKAYNAYYGAAAPNILKKYNACELRTK